MNDVLMSSLRSVPSSKAAQLHIVNARTMGGIRAEPQQVVAAPLTCLFQQMAGMSFLSLITTV
jgi:hypothetical protein